MKRYLAFILPVVLFSFLCSCEGEKPSVSVTQSAAEVVINEPSDNTVNGYRNNTVDVSTPISDTVYYANKNSKKFHKSDCGSVKDIKAENCYKTNNRDELILKGYTPCKSCNP